MNWWKNLSVSKKLYCVVGAMGLLIAMELFSLIFAMRTLSAIRAFATGEGHWSKAQKDSISYLQKYVITQDEKFYGLFLERIKVPLGDFRARIEILKPEMNETVATEALRAGNNHPDDIPEMINLMRRFSSTKYLKEPLRHWEEGDVLLHKLISLSEKIHLEIKRKKRHNSHEIQSLMEEISVLNGKLTVVEDGFSYSLGVASRAVENLLLITLILAAVTIVSIGLYFAISFSKTLTAVLNELNNAAKEVGRGNFSQLVPVRSKDELGELTRSINKMTQNLSLQTSAINIRDEFLSIASHELKTPLTTLKLQTQMKKRNFEKDGYNSFTAEKIQKLHDNEEFQINRLIRLVDDMLDISRLRSKKLILKFETVNLVIVVKDVLQRLEPQILESGINLQLEAPDELTGSWDSYRLEQVAINLLTNAIKYGKQKPVVVRIFKKNNCACLMVTDQGIGIHSKDKERIFEQFERAVHPNEVSGLGLGLYIAKQIVLAHNGSIVVESEIEKGSTFTVSLPL